MQKKSIFSIIIVFVIMIVNFNIYGANVKVYSNKTSLNVGETATITIDGTGVAGEITSVVSSNSSVLAISGSATGWIEDNKKNITVTAKTKGSAYIIVNGTVANLNNSEDESTISTSSASITVVEKKITTTNTNNNKNNTTNNNKNNNNTNKTTTTKNTATTTATTKKSSNTNLSKLNLNVEGLTPAFSNSVTNYSLSVNDKVNEIKVTATPQDSGAKVNVSGNTNLKEGNNKITILVVAEDGTKKTFYINVTKSANAEKANAYLEALVINDKSLTPTFQSETLEYDIGEIENDVSELEIVAIAKSEKAKVEVVGNKEIPEGNGTIKIIVTAEDGKTKNEYVIKYKKLTKEETNALKPVENTTDENEEDLNDFGNKVSVIGYILKDNWLVLALFGFCLVEFFQIVYLYKNNSMKDDLNNIKLKRNKKVKTNNEKLNMQTEDFKSSRQRHFRRRK